MYNWYVGLKLVSRYNWYVGLKLVSRPKSTLLDSRYVLTLAQCCVLITLRTGTERWVDTQSHTHKHVFPPQNVKWSSFTIQFQRKLIYILQHIWICNDFVLCPSWLLSPCVHESGLRLLIFSFFQFYGKMGNFF